MGARAEVVVAATHGVLLGGALLADAIRRLASGTVHPEHQPTAHMPRGGDPGLAVHRT
jgi:hypothetical protein